MLQIIILAIALIVVILGIFYTIHILRNQDKLMTWEKQSAVAAIIMLPMFAVVISGLLITTI